MRAILPGKPQAKLQAVCTTQWGAKRIVIYISGNALVILGGAHDLLQTIYHDTPDDLNAVVIDEATGKIATSSDTTVYIYRPCGNATGILKWSQQISWRPDATGAAVVALSWGSSEELLVGTSCLRLYQTAEDIKLIWTRGLSSPPKFALFSRDATLVASTAHYDRLVKVWRRLSFGSDDVRFDSTYLSHPATVTGARWRGSEDRNQCSSNLLYTICADSRMRVWAAIDPRGQQLLQLWAEIDLQESIQPRSIGSATQSCHRYALFIDSPDFICATQIAAQVVADGRKEHYALDHLAEVARCNSDVCVVLDDKGHMSAWGIENVGANSRAGTDVFNVAHVEHFDVVSLLKTFQGTPFVQFLTFCNENHESGLTLIVHQFDGTIAWLEGRIDDVFDPSCIKDRLRLKALWTGHERPIKKIVRNISGKAFISRTSDNEGLIWKSRDGKDQLALSRHSTLESPERIHRTCLLYDGDFVINLHHHSISLWNSHDITAKLVASRDYLIQGKPLCLLLLPESTEEYGLAYVATISSSMKGIVWKVSVPYNFDRKRINARTMLPPAIEQYCDFDLDSKDELAFILPVDPAGSTTTVSSFLDTFAKDIAVSYNHDGVLHTWTARLNTKKKSIDWLVTSTVITAIREPSLTSGSSNRKIAVVDSARNGLTVWDSRGGQLEYDKHFGLQETIQDLDWSSTPDYQSILAVGFPHKVIILSQMRYDYLDRGPAWAPIREVYIGESTCHIIGDSTWLGNGNLVIGAGNQLFIYDKAVKSSDEMVTDLSIPVHNHSSMDIFSVVTLLNGPLPVFHPQFLAQCILAGKFVHVQRIVINLNNALKYFTDGDRLDSMMGIAVNEFFTEPNDIYLTRKRMRISPTDCNSENDTEKISDELASSLNAKLTNIALPDLSSQEQINLAYIVACVATAQKHQRSMDDNAMRYLLLFQQFMLRKAQSPATNLDITWREIAWAFHSNSQDILVDLVSKQYQGRMLWKHARESGMFMWITEPSALRAQFEVIARNEYTKTDERNPINCSLYYLALGKKNVLQGLWRMAGWNREQSATQKLLSNNFKDPRWKTAALKNAYALLGKRRFEYAAAFFLLAGNLSDAVNVCAHQLQDLQLAVTLARVSDGDNCLVLRELLEDIVLPRAAFEGDRWLATWAFWMLGRRDMALRALITPIYTELDTPGSLSQRAKSYLTSDPALVVLYKQLRDMTLQTLKGASMVSPRAEWEFIIQCARLYDRMGCDLLALDLVRNWEFLSRPREPQKLPREALDPGKILGRQSSLVVADLSSPQSPILRECGGSGIAQPAKVFKEPDVNSLLDTFGF